MTQKQLANMLEVDQRTVSAWEKQVCEPSFELLENFVTYLTRRLTVFYHKTLDNGKKI